MESGSFRENSLGLTGRYQSGQPLYLDGSGFSDEEALVPLGRLVPLSPLTKPTKMTRLTKLT